MRSRNELAALSRQLITAQEAERTRIARELHDSVGRQLGAIKYSLERRRAVAAAVLEEASPICSAEHRGLAGCHAGLRRCRHGSASPPCSMTSARPPPCPGSAGSSPVSYPTLQVASGCRQWMRIFPQRLATTVFRSLQELLNNVAKHSQARDGVVTLTARVPEGLILEVRRRRCRHRRGGTDGPGEVRARDPQSARARRDDGRSAVAAAVRAGRRHAGAGGWRTRRPRRLPGARRSLQVTCPGFADPRRGLLRRSAGSRVGSRPLRTANSVTVAVL